MAATADDPLFVRGTRARQIVGIGRDKFRRYVRDGIIPSFSDPETGHRYYSVSALEDWARRNGAAA